MNHPIVELVKTPLQKIKIKQHKIMDFNKFTTKTQQAISEAQQIAMVHNNQQIEIAFAGHFYLYYIFIHVPTPSVIQSCGETG